VTVRGKNCCSVRMCHTRQLTDDSSRHAITTLFAVLTVLTALRSDRYPP
jgi:hypothetical protein